ERSNGERQTRFLPVDALLSGIQRGHFRRPAVTAAGPLDLPSPTPGSWLSRSRDPRRAVSTRRRRVAPSGSGGGGPLGLEGLAGSTDTGRALFGSPQGSDPVEGIAATSSRAASAHARAPVGTRLRQRGNAGTCARR